VPCGGRVDNGQIAGAGCPAGLCCQGGDLDQPEQLVEARQRKRQQDLDILACQPRALFENIAERAAVSPEPSRERPGKVELGGMQPAASADATDRRGSTTQGCAERVTERVRRVG
jgi:hypothetical protein